MNNIKFICLSSVTSAGKDILFKILDKILKEKGIKCQKLTFLDPLKLEINSFIKSQFGFSAYTDDEKQKAIINDILISYKIAKRKISNECYCINLIKDVIEQNIQDGFLPFITDLSYINELQWAKNFGGKVIHITRFDKYNYKFQPINSDEGFNNYTIESLADYKLIWPTSLNMDFLEEIVKEQLKQLIEKL